MSLQLAQALVRFFNSFVFAYSGRVNQELIGTSEDSHLSFLSFFCISLFPHFQIDVPRHVTVWGSGLHKLIGKIPSFTFPILHFTFGLWVWCQTAISCLALGRNSNHAFFLWFLPEVIISAKSAKGYVDLCRCFGKLGLKFIFLMKLKSIDCLGVRCKSFSQLRGHIGCSRCQLGCLFSSLLFTGTYKASLGRCSTAHVGARCCW